MDRLSESRESDARTLLDQVDELDRMTARLLNQIDAFARSESEREEDARDARFAARMILNRARRHGWNEVIALVEPLVTFLDEHDNVREIS